MKKFFTLTLACVFSAMTFAQETADAPKAWDFSGSLGLNAAATGLWNWAAGGNNNINGVVYGRFRLLYDKDNFNWDTKLNMEYGLTWIDQEFDPFQKSSDKFDFNTQVGWKFKPSWLLSAQVGFNTQFANGRNYGGTDAYDPIISRGLAPAYLDLSLGIDWKPNSIFSLYLSPVAGRITTVYLPKSAIDAEAKNMEDPEYRLDEVLKEKYAVWKYDAAGDHAYKQNYDGNVRAELGLTFKGNINYTYKGMTLQTALTLFTPYKWDKTALYQDAQAVADGLFYTEQKPGMEFVGFRDQNRRFGNFDVDWTVALSYQFLKCLQVTFSTDLRYYNGVMIDKVYNRGTADEYVASAERVQFKGVIGVGVGYSF